MKQLTELMKFTKKSILFVFLGFAWACFLVFTQIGFENKNSIIISCISILFLACTFIGYLIYVLCLYYKLPKNKKDAMGVLFFINTHGNHSDYKTLTDKFCEKFEELSSSIEKNKLEPIILSEKQISSIKNITDKRIQKKLLEKTRCIFGVFMKSTDLGENNSEYELQINGMMTPPDFRADLKEIFDSNFDYIFKGLKVNTLNKNNDLKDLQNLSTQLYFICQLLFAMTNMFLEYYEGAITLFDEILLKIKEESSTFYKQLTIITHNFICYSAIILVSKQYQNFIYNNKYDIQIADKALKTISKSIHLLNNIHLEIDYHSSKAVHHLLCGNLIESKGEIKILFKKFKMIPPNKRSWLYSDAFLLAYENNPNTYNLIPKKYSEIKNNISQDPTKIYAFINSMLEKYPNNLGLKLAMLYLVYYKDLNKSFLPPNLQDDVVIELISIGQQSLASSIKSLKFIE